MGGDAAASWPARLRWPETLKQASLLGPREELARLAATPHATIEYTSDIETIASPYRKDLAQQAQHLAQSITQKTNGQPT